MSTRVQLSWPGGTGSGTLGDAPLGRGGEGSVWPVTVDPGVPAPSGSLVVKLYHPGADPQLAARRTAKVTAMLAAAPATDAICWPLAAARTPDGQTGFVMTALPSATHREWAQFANAADRRRTAATFSVRYAVAACRNLAIAAGAVHAAGHVLGDVNESNVFIGADATVRIVDADSAQVRTAAGEMFRCEVGKPEYTAPELAGRPLRECDRTPATDVFGFAVLVFQLLTGGAHPTDGAPVDLDADPPSVTERIAHRWTPGLLPPPGCPLRPVPRVPSAALPSRLVPLLAAALDVDPARRPTLAALAAALDDVGARLTPCPAEPGHAYDSRDGSCGWCAHAAAGNPDPWGSAAGRAAQLQQTQQALPALSLQSGAAAPTTARRAPIAAPGSTPAGAAWPTQAAAATPPWPMNASSAAALQAVLQGMPAAAPLGAPPRAAAPAAARPVPPAGGRTILIDPDGQPVPRPPLATLALQQPLLALKCALSELPETWKPVPATRQTGRSGRGPLLAAASVAALLAVLAVAALVLLVGTRLLAAQAGFTTSPLLLAALLAVSTAGSCAGVGLLAWRHLRRRGPGDALQTWRGADVAAYARTAALCGPVLLVAAVGALLVGAVGAVIRMVEPLLGRQG